MTVEANTPSVSYLENGVTTAFAAPFRYRAASDLVVTRIAADGTKTVLANGADWNASAGDTDLGGAVTLTVAGPAGGRIRIERATARAQQVNYDTSDTFPADTHELALDQLMMIAQELDAVVAGLLARALRLPDGGTLVDMPQLDTLKGKVLGFDPVTGAPIGYSNSSSAADAAATSEANALAYKLAAEAARDATLNAFDQFDDRYLGAKAADPVLDNDGNALVGGTLYFNSTVNEMRIWTGAAWVAAYVSGTGFVAKTGDTMTGKLLLAAVTAAAAGLNIGQGAAAVAAPVNGDIWALASGIYARLAGVTQQLAFLDSPAFANNPTAPTQAPGDKSTKLATTAFVNTPAIQAVASAATVTPTFADDQVNITAQAAALQLANPTGTAQDGHGIAVRIKDNGTARAISYGAQYRAVGVTLPATTVLGKTLYLGMVFNAADTKWDVVAVAQEA